MITDNLQPPSNQDGAFGFDGSTSNNDELTNSTTTVDYALEPAQAKSLANDSYFASEDYLRMSRRNQWRNSLRAYKGLHPEGSKYLTSEYAYRTALYMPKTRSTIRKDEAEVAGAFFSNEDVVNITAAQQDDPTQAASAAVIKALVQYRLTKSIPWFLTAIGASQDCDVMGACFAKVYWKYSERVISYENRLSLNADGVLENEQVANIEIVDDKPAINLLPPENIRVDPSCDWRDPINTSPYVIEMIPMTYGEVRDMIDNNIWLDVDDGAIISSTSDDDNQTRNARESGRVAAQNSDTTIARPSRYKVCWIRSVIVRWKGRDWFYYTTSGTGQLLTNPVPLEEAFLNGERPYVMGIKSPEAHIAYPTSKTEYLSDMQRAINDQTNLRFDNIKLALNPRQLLREGSGIDPNDIRTFMPGKAIYTRDPDADVKWDRPPDITASAYQEQNILGSLFDELAGDQTSSSMLTQMQQQSATGQHLLSGIASGMTEYELRVFAETFVQPVISKLIKLIQAYEDDETILAIAASDAKLFQRFGINQVTDELLRAGVTTKVNAGIGATNNAYKLKRLNEAADTLGKMFGPTTALGLNFEEVTKEVFGACGFDDGKRFFKPGFDPAQAQQEMQAARQPQQQPPQTDPAELQTKAAIAQSTNQARVQAAAISAHTRATVAATQLQIARERQAGENMRQHLAHGHQLHTNRMQAFINAAQQQSNGVV